MTNVGYGNSSDLAVSPDGASVYVANNEINSRGFADPPRVISTATNTVVASIADKSTTNPGIAITPDGSTGFVTNNFEFQGLGIFGRHQYSHKRHSGGLSAEV